jgi:hypothetical protein
VSSIGKGCDHAAAHATCDDVGNSLPLQDIDSGQIG